MRREKWRDDNYGSALAPWYGCQPELLPANERIAQRVRCTPEKDSGCRGGGETKGKVCTPVWKRRLQRAAADARGVRGD